MSDVTNINHTNRYPHFNFARKKKISLRKEEKTNWKNGELPTGL